MATTNNTMLTDAAGTGAVDLLATLLRGGANVCAEATAGEFQPLHYAASGGHADACELLLDYGAQVGAIGVANVTPLHCAIRRRRLHGTCADLISVCECLIARGADVNGVKEQTFSPLALAVLYAHADVCSLLVAEGADIHLKSVGASPLHFAIGQGHLSVCQLFVAHCAPIPTDHLLPGISSHVDAYVAAARDAGWKRRAAALAFHQHAAEQRFRDWH